MMKDTLINIWTITLKDIRDAFHNRVAVSIMISALIMLALPKWLGSMIAPPSSEVLVYDPQESAAAALLEDHGYSVVRVRSEDDLVQAVRRGTTSLGLMVNPEEIQAYVSWSDRGEIPNLLDDLHAALGPGAAITFDDHLLYPVPDSFSMLGLSFLTMLVVMLIVGINLVPSMIFEEKQTKTLDALLVSPATEAQLVAAKALVGMFFTLLVAVMLFGLNWNSVVHWELALLFTLLCGLFSVSIGLLIGSIYQRGQDSTGVTSGLTMLFIGGIFVRLVGLSVPTVVGIALDWLPSTWLFRLLQTVFYEKANWPGLLPGIANLLAVCFVLMGVVVWRLRSRDR